MATQAVARETICALRRQIAKIEGSLAEVLAAPAGDGPVLLRHKGAPAGSAFVATGIGAMDAALGGGVPRAALTEIHGAETRDAGAVAGFALSLAAMLLATISARLPVLWIGTSEIFGEAGFPYALGLSGAYGLTENELLFAETGKLTDALWIAEEAACLKALGAVILEVRGNPARLDLSATRRLHARAQQAGRPLFLLRQAGRAEPTAAPVRFVVSPVSAASRHTLAGPLVGSIGPPGFSVSISKCRTARTGQFILEWNADGRFFRDRKPDADEFERHAHAAAGTAHPGAVLSLSRA